MHATRPEFPGLSKPVVRNVSSRQRMNSQAASRHITKRRWRFPRGGKVRDYLQPEWGMIRFFAGSKPWASILRYSELPRPGVVHARVPGIHDDESQRLCNPRSSDIGIADGSARQNQGIAGYDPGFAQLTTSSRERCFALCAIWR